jgi:hypothetical protein
LSLQREVVTAVDAVQNSCGPVCDPRFEKTSLRDGCESTQIAVRRCRGTSQTGAGPACWIEARSGGGRGELLSLCYRPILNWIFEDGGNSGPKKGAIWYMRVGIARGKFVELRSRNGIWTIPGFPSRSGR